MEIGRQGKLLSIPLTLCYCLYRKTAIAIDTIINQKRFNDAADESEDHSYYYDINANVIQRLNSTAFTVLLVRREVQLLR